MPIDKKHKTLLFSSGTSSSGDGYGKRNGCDDPLRIPKHSGTANSKNKVMISEPNAESVPAGFGLQPRTKPSWGRLVATDAEGFSPDPSSDSSPCELPSPSSRPILSGKLIDTDASPFTDPEC